MEDSMPALTDRQKARERLSQVFQTILDKMIPADEAVPLQGSKFVEWEDQGDELARTVVPMFLEERAALEASAQADSGGNCPQCGSNRIYLTKQETQAQQVEVLTPHGPVVLKKQRCRCRSCGRSFSPSGTGLGIANRGQSVAQGGGADRS
jgi:DNA-directed RNA polymerase subunit RPC12/RpoP